MLKYVSNVDTIYILVDIEEYEKSANKLLEYLKEEKEVAKVGLNANTNYSHMVTIGDMVFQIRPNGSKGYMYILHNNGYEIKIAQTRSKLESFYPIQVRISSEYLWSYGLNRAWEIIYTWINKSFGNIIDNKVYRVDLCCHVSNVDFVTNYEVSYKGNFKKTQVFHTGRNINCLKFGSRTSKNIYCRIYDKSLEVQEKKQKIWFYDIWKNCNMNITKVWNLEFEIKSELLREFNINSIEDVIRHLKNLWEYCTKEFIVKIDRTNKRVERCNVNKDWKELQKAYNEFISVGMIVRNKQVQLDAKVLLPNIVGCITSYSARKGTNDIKKIFNCIYKDTEKYLKNKQTNFENEVAYKQALLIDKGGKSNG